jgi:uncharacterized membrane protein YfcA
MHILFAGSESLYIVFINMLTHNSPFHILRFKKSNVLFHIGGGVFVVPLLIDVLKTPTKIAAASSTFIVCFSSLTGFLGYASMEEMNWGFLLPAALACLIGGRAGAKIMSARMTDKYIHVIFSGILFIMCAKLLHQSLF